VNEEEKLVNNGRKKKKRIIGTSLSKIHQGLGIIGRITWKSILVPSNITILKIRLSGGHCYLVASSWILAVTEFTSTAYICYSL